MNICINAYVLYLLNEQPQPLHVVFVLCDAQDETQPHHAILKIANSAQRVQNS